MIKISVVAMGKLKESYLSCACNEYIKRLSRYCDIDVKELPPENLPDNPSEALIKAALSKEATKIEKAIPKNSQVIALCVEGNELSSEMFAKTVGDFENEGRPICFVIGSSYGLDERIKNSAGKKLSLSKMTFPHQLFRVILLEQIYRAFKINEGGTYHK